LLSSTRLLERSNVFNDRINGKNLDQSQFWIEQLDKLRVWRMLEVTIEWKRLSKELSLPDIRALFDMLRISTPVPLTLRIDKISAKLFKP
jgi:hypothetical protein